MQKILRTLFCLILSFTVVACGQNASFQLPQQNTTSSLDTNQGSSTPIDESTPTGSSYKPTICSDLPFTNVNWPSQLTEYQVNIFALAMNISGSFEGTTGWTNISNNFDGQGVSLGLFNQNLGQGSLQPLLINLAQKNITKLKSFYSKTQYDSMLAMLSKWQGTPVSPLSKVTTTVTKYQNDFSALDDPSAIEALGVHQSQVSQKLTSTNQSSVDWAVNTVFNGSQFKPEWKSAFQNMAGSPEFVTIQVAAAKTIHDKAMGYMKQFGFKEMRAYFFFFDIVVQNGGIYTSIADKYFAWEKLNKTASETTKLKKLLEYRLTVVISQYQQDVRSRKLAVIDGKGLVHGDQRNFSEEYCAPSWTGTIPKTSLP